MTDSIRFVMGVDQECKKRNEPAKDQQRDRHRFERCAAETGLQHVVEVCNRCRKKREPAAVGEVIRTDGQRVEAEDADGGADQELHACFSLLLRHIQIGNATGI